MTAIVRFLRDAEWADRTRIRNYLILIAIGQAVALAALLIMARSGVDPRGEPLGTDFVSFWTAGKLALAHRPEAIYSPEAHLAAERAFFGHPIGWYAFFYPPIFILVCLPLGALPYLAALAIWLTSTFAALFAALRALSRRFAHPLMLAAFPAVFGNIGHGQNAFLSAALFAGGAACLDRRPWIAGVLFGALSFKPQLAAVIPLALLVTGRWRALASLALIAAALALLTLPLFGWETWRAFLLETPLARETLERGLVDPAKMQSVFSAIRVLGGGVRLAWAAQGAASLSALAGLIYALRHTRDGRRLGALAACTACLATPFLLDYDLTLLIVPIAVVFDEAMQDGFAPYEKTTLFAAYLLAGFARPIAEFAHLPLTPIVVSALMFVVARRCLSGTARAKLASPPVCEPDPLPA
jgi:alpha-1,2-mannosyltransferase